MNTKFDLSVPTTDASTPAGTRPWRFLAAIGMLLACSFALTPSNAMQLQQPETHPVPKSDTSSVIEPTERATHPGDWWQDLYDAQGSPLTASKREALGLRPFGLYGVTLAPTPEAEPIVPCTIERPPASSDAAGVRAASWPGGVIPYEFNANVTTQNRTRFEQAIVILEGVCAVNWVLRTGQTDYVEVRATGVGTPEDCSNSSFVGRLGGLQILRMCSWASQGVLLHEMMHAMGFQHEQSRLDRDQFVIIRPENIINEYEHNFNVAAGTIATGPYDFRSIMHYAPCAFFEATSGGCSSCRPSGNTLCHTVTPVPAFAAEVGGMGQLVGITPLDTHGLRSLYPLSTWRFVNAARAHAGPETGVGTDSWRTVVPALISTPIGGGVFVMPGTYTATGIHSRPMKIEAPVGGVIIR